MKLMQDELRDELRGEIRQLRNEMLDGFDGVYKRIERLEMEYEAIRAGLYRLEQQVANLNERIDKVALRSELEELKARVAELERQLN